MIDKFVHYVLSGWLSITLGTSHNLSWRGGGGGGGEIGGPSIFFGWSMGFLKMPKDDLGGSSSFF